MSAGKTPVFLKRDGGHSEFYVRFGNSSPPLNAEEAVRYIQSHWPQIRNWQAPTTKTPTDANSLTGGDTKSSCKVTCSNQLGTGTRIKTLTVDKREQMATFNDSQQELHCIRPEGRLVFTIDFDDDIGINLSCWIGKPYDPSKVSTWQWVWDPRFHKETGIWYTQIASQLSTSPKSKKYWKMLTRSLSNDVYDLMPEEDFVRCELAQSGRSLILEPTVIHVKCPFCGLSRMYEEWRPSIMSPSEKCLVCIHCDHNTSWQPDNKKV